MASPLDERRRLLRRLTAFFEGKGEDPELDEYELVEAFDFAGDNNDEGLQEHIIDYAVRRYPDYDPLLIRRALLLLDTGYPQRAREIAGKVSDTLVLRDLFFILEAIDAGTPAAEIFDRLDDVLSRHERFGDEDMIRFIDTALDNQGGYEWLKTRMPVLRAHLEYLPTLLYEMAQSAKEEMRWEDAEEYVEELTMIEPFEIDYWEMLAEIHFAMESYDKASSDLEYALAIDPHSAHSRMLSAHVRLGRAGGELDEALVRETLATIDDLIFTDSLDVYPLNLAVTALDSVGLREESIERLKKFIEKFPLNVRAIDLLLQREPGKDDILAILDNYYEKSGEQAESYWMAWATHHYDLANFEAAAVLLHCYSSHRQLTSWLLYLRSLYLCNRSAYVIKAVVDAELLSTVKFDVEAGNTPDMEYAMTCLIFIMSLIRCNNEKLAKEIINVELKRCTSYMKGGDLERNIGILGYKQVLTKIRRELGKGTYPDDYDPMLLPQNINASKW